MRIVINGEARTVDAGATVESVAELLDVAPGARGVAIALDGEVVTRSQWSATELRDGCRVEVVSAIGGG